MGGLAQHALVTLGGRALREPRDVPTDAQGNFVFRGLPPGVYELDAISHGAHAKGSLSVNLVGEEHLEGLAVMLSAQGSIAGRVIDAEGKGVVGVSVRYTDPETGDTCEAIASEEGAFVCTMLAGGGRYQPTLTPDPASAIQLTPAEGHRFGDLVRV